MRKPLWLNKRIDFQVNRKLKGLLRQLGLHTVCEEARCPNISECFHKGVVTFLILGDVCTRNCTFCNVKKGIPSPPDEGEPYRLQEAVERLGLKHVVITSPTRDDLPDGGAEMFYRTIKILKGLPSPATIEVLIPDFKGSKDSLLRVLEADPDIVAHNLETVPSLYPALRPGADYRRSLEVLSFIKKETPRIFTKSGVMLGLGENKTEVLSLLFDLRRVSCDFVSIGQYLPPSKSHYSLCKFIPLQEFNYYKEKALQIGFRYVQSSPYTRSSYLADTYLEGSSNCFLKKDIFL